MSIRKSITHQLKHNSAIHGALLSGGAALVTKLYEAYQERQVLRVRFNSDMPDYAAITRYITDHLLDTERSRSFTYSADSRWRDGEETTENQTLAIGYGNHAGRFRGTLIEVERSLDESNRAGTFKETLVVTFITRDKAVVRDFIDELVKITSAGSAVFKHVPIYTNSSSYWDRTGKLPLRSIESVFTADNAGQHVVDAVRAFEAKKDEHHRLGLPHHIGILLHGEPGCGKSSLIHAVASELQRSIYYLNLGSVTDDSCLTSLLAGTRDWSKALLVLEDIDATGVMVNRAEGGAEKGKKKKGKAKEQDTAVTASSSPVSLSVLLNSLDGILCPDGLVVIATTNHLDRLDPALRRPGRFDHLIELGKLGYDDFVRMARLFGKDPNKFLIANDVEMTGAQMRAILLDVA